MTKLNLVKHHMSIFTTSMEFLISLEFSLIGNQCLTIYKFRMKIQRFFFFLMYGKDDAMMCVN